MERELSSPQKKRTMRKHADRNVQFENIAKLKKQYLDAGQPLISKNTDKKGCSEAGFLPRSAICRSNLAWLATELSSTVVPRSRSRRSTYLALASSRRYSALIRKLHSDEQSLSNRSLQRFTALTPEQPRDHQTPTISESVLDAIEWTVHVAENIGSNSYSPL